MVVDTSIGHVAAKRCSRTHPDLCERHASLMPCPRVRCCRILVRPMMRSCWSIGRDSHSVTFVLPLLKQQDCAGSTGNSFGHECCRRRVEQRRIFRAIDEAGKVAIVAGKTNSRFSSPSVAWPARLWTTERAISKTTSISTARQPYQRIMLRAWHNESFCALDLLV